MSGIIHLESFLIACLLIIITPGNDTVYIISKSLSQGSKAGLIGSLGISCGILIHTTLAALGLSVLISTSIIAFTLIKYLGAAYIIYIGIKMIRSKSKLSDALQNKQGPTKTTLKLFSEGVLTNVLNPKVALFFIAFLPQFISLEHKTSSQSFFILGLIYIASTTLYSLILVWGASALLKKIRHYPNVIKYIDRLCGSALVLLGLRVAFSKQ